MKLLTQSGLLYSAVQSQTVNGHYGTFPEIDWSVTVDESVSVPGVISTTTIGLNPMVRQVETLFDGGKAITGNGSYTSTVTFGWVLKMFDTTQCAGNSTINVPTGHVIWTTVVTSNSSASCISQYSWIYSPENNYNGTQDTIDRSTLFIDAAEEWKDGKVISGEVAMGENPVFNMVGGTNALTTYGMGRWQMQQWMLDNDGAAMTGATYNPASTALFKVGPAGGTPNSALVNMTVPITTGGSGTEFGRADVIQNSCLTATAAFYATNAFASTNTNKWAGGFIGSNTTCLDYVIDEMSISGTYILTLFDMDFVQATADPAATTKATNVNAGPLKWASEDNAVLDSTTLALLRVYNYGVLKQVSSMVEGAATSGAKCVVLFSAPETYHQSYIVGHYVNTEIIAGLKAVNALYDVTKYGQINAMWVYAEATPSTPTTTGLFGIATTHIVFTGMHLGKGMVGGTTLPQVTHGTDATAMTITIDAGSKLLIDASVAPISNMHDTRIRQINSPDGGVMQFKGLSRSTVNDAYVEVNCRRIEGYWMNTSWSDISNSTVAADTNGFIISCMTGISQCVLDNTAIDGTSNYQVAGSMLSWANHQNCLKDPRYLTWRQMTVQIEYGGTVQWFRTDSYWNRTGTIVGSAWGPGVTNSAHTYNGADNTNVTTSNNGRSYVFALGDGSGISLSHITGGTGVITANTTNQVSGTGANGLTTAKTSFENSFPNRVDGAENFCSSTNLLLSGLSDTSTLASAVTAYSDGYLATITMALDWFQAGATGGWRGVCMVYYTSQYIQDDTNGAVCMAATQGTTGPADLGSVSLMHVKASTWQPPAISGSVIPTSQALSDAKYGIVTAPVATLYIYTGSYYASAAWYQPKYASSYADIARFGKDRYAGAYCMSGATSTSYFTAPAAGIQLQSAVTLAAGAIALGSAILAM